MGAFHTGQTALATGTYSLAGHMESNECQPTEDKKILLAAGQTFPPCIHCETAAFWVS
jgi:YjzC-like protein